MWRNGTWLSPLKRYKKQIYKVVEEGEHIISIAKFVRFGHLKHNRLFFGEVSFVVGANFVDSAEVFIWEFGEVETRSIMDAMKEKDL